MMPTKRHAFNFILLVTSIFSISTASLAADDAELRKEQLLMNMRQEVDHISTLQQQRSLIVNHTVLVQPRRQILRSQIEQFILSYGKEELRENASLDSEGEYEVARVFQRGYGYPPDLPESFLWFQMASESGNHEARMMAAGYRLLGRGCQRDVKTASKEILVSLIEKPIPTIKFVTMYSGSISLYGFGTPLWLLFYVAIFWLAWIWRKRPGGFTQFIFPRNIYWSRSFLMEVQLLGLTVFGIVGFLVDTLFSLFLLNYFLESIKDHISIHIDLMSIFSSAPGVGVMLYFLIVFLTNDLFAYLAHFLTHRVAFLWEFHRVHHAPATITPLTLYRMHPVDYLVRKSFLFAGSLFTGMFLAQGSAESILFLQLTFLSYSLTVLNNLFVHSHLPLSLGFLNSIFVTPAMHHIHHSKSDEHSDKNLGALLMIYDKIFGTISMPKPGEQIEFGVMESQVTDYDNLLNFYWLPFKRAFGTLGFIRSNPRNQSDPSLIN